jgi:hypothetical protein
MGAEKAWPTPSDRVLELRPREHGPEGGPCDGPGTKPRARRSTTGAPATTRATESSQRFAISRSCTRKASARPRRRVVASPFETAIGSSARLPEVITSGSPAAARSR